MARKRRGRGEGGIYRRADGLWCSCISLGHDEHGKRRRRVIYGGSKLEVQNKLRELQASTGRGIDADAGRLTVGTWLTRWLEMVRPTVEPNTYAPYERHVRLHITPFLGSIRLAKLKRGDVVSFYPALSRAGVSPALQRKVGTTLTIALNKAVDLELIPSNPAMKVRKPKAVKAEMHVLDPDQVVRFLDAAAADRLQALYVTAMDSGARPGELFALLWPDVDFDRSFVSINKSLEDLQGALRVKNVKTAKGRRRIDLSQHTLAVLAEHRKAMLAAGYYAPDKPVFCDCDGGYLRISNLRRDSFLPIIARANAVAVAAAKKLSKATGQKAAPALLPTIRLYDLRHTCATLLLLADTPAKVVSERLGHGSITLTLDTYSHVLPTMQRRAADVMGRLLGRDHESRSQAE